MSNKHLVAFILPEFIKILQIYDMSYNPIIATLTMNRLSNAKHATAKRLLMQLKKLAENGDVSVFSDTNISFEANLLELVRSESRQSEQSNLTMPSRPTQISEWAATPRIRTMISSQAVVPPVSDEDWAPPTPAITAEDDLSTEEADSLLALTKVLKKLRKIIHDERRGFRTGSFDAILYGMSRCLYFIRWFYKEINIPVDSPDKNVDGIEPNQKYCLQLIWLIASHMCHYSFDRAYKSWDNYKIYTKKTPHYSTLDNKYYLNSGIVNLPKVTPGDMQKLDDAGNIMVNLLTTLTDIYHTEVKTPEEKMQQFCMLDFVTTTMLDAKTMPIEYMNKDFLEKIRSIKNNLIVPATTETVVTPMLPLLEVVLFDSRNDEEDITLEDRVNRLDTMSPSKMLRTHSTNSTISNPKLDL
jgi:hypothetical protein